MTLPAAAAWAPAEYRSVYGAGARAAADMGRRAAATGGTDGRTPDRYIDPAPHTVRAALINVRFDVVCDRYFLLSRMLCTDARTTVSFAV